MEVSIGISNRHVHLCEDDLKKLFGNDYKLRKLKDINQPNQYAAVEAVTIKTDKDVIENVRILGPTRNYSQVEISKTDAYKLGINPPIRQSGDLEGSSPITIVGPLCELKLDFGCIIADRHIHLNEEQLKQWGLEGKENVSVLISGIKGGILHNVRLKVSEESYFEMHLDTDDANAHLIKNNDIGIIINE